MPKSTDYRPAAVTRRSPRRMQRWARRTFTRENLVQSIKTFAWVGPLTILIWVYAEREQLKVDQNISIAIDLRSDNPGRVVTLKKPYPDKMIVASLSGSREDLDRLEDLLQRGAGGESAVQIPISSSLLTGMTHEIPTAEALESVPLFKKYRVVVSDCRPTMMAVDVDELVQKDLPVQLPPDLPNIVGQPTFTPASVTVRGPSRLMAATKLVAYADLAGLDVLKTPGDHMIQGVRIKPLDGLTFVPSDVKANIAVRESDVAYDSKPLIVWVTGPAEKLKDVRVECKPAQVPGVRIMGPPDKIALLERPDFTPPPRAILEILPSDDPGGEIERQLRIDLPPNMGLHVADDDSSRRVTFQLIDARPGGE